MAGAVSPFDASNRFVPICAIGASAGGVTALRSLFRLLPNDLGLAYVVILHLSPEHPSAMAEILAGSTSMGVLQVTDSPTLKPNCVYVIPPDRELVIENDEIRARPFSQPRGSRAPIDMFFRSIAAARGDGMAVVLSGSGSDGSLGVKAIHEGGGVVFVQEPAEAEFPVMPQNAIATGVANFVGTLATLAERIGEVARSKEAVRSLDADGVANDLRRVVSHLRARTGHDFSNYKRATVMRRVLRRMQVCRMPSLTDYAEYMRATPEEAQELFSDLLISVTMFFRDEAAFVTLAEKCIAPLFDEAGDRGLRVWVVGCASGEEAYSVGMLLLEEAERRKVSIPLQIFASDLDEGALATGREGRYPRSIEADVSEARLKRFFVDEGTHYRVRKELRDIVLFACHSVLKDPPFFHVDLITCRNLLIYLERGLQQQVLGLFHYALVDHGMLFLGSAETIDTTPKLYFPIHREARIYRSQANAAHGVPRLPYSDRLTDPSSLPAPRVQGSEKAAKLPVEIHMEALEGSAPPSALVDIEHQILHLSANVGRFIQPSGGEFSGKLPLVVRQELRLDMQVALERALQRGHSTLTPTVLVNLGGATHFVNLFVSPVIADEARRALVLFLDAGEVSDAEKELLGTAETRPDELRRLYAELRAAQETIIAVRKEQETSIQELRAANEELQSVNEEYRSTAEELETSKEELQSMNEELQTVNAELKSKLASISTAHSDLQNLTAATEIGTLFLDTELRIRMFTPPISLLFSVTENDVGRAITDFTHQLDDTSVERDARHVLRDLVPVTREVRTRTGRHFTMRLRPYRTVEDHINGIVLTFVDVSERILAERELIDSDQRYRTLFNSIDEGFCVISVMFDAEGRAYDYCFVDVNAAFERQTGLSDAKGKCMSELNAEHEPHWFEHYGRVAKSRVAERFEAEGLGRYYEVFAFPYGDPAEHEVGILFKDVSERRQQDQHRILLTHELSHRVRNTLAVVHSLARLPVPDGTTVVEFQDKLTGRIMALARAHGQLMETDWHKVELKSLVTETMSTYVEDDSDRLVLEGGPLELSPKQGLSVSLILHELATNAIKYGALGIADGRLEVRWQRNGRMLRLNWQERGGPKVETPIKNGFGTTLIERVVTYELSGKAKLAYDAGGFMCRLEFPIEELDTADQAPSGTT